jgi:hypothetical protein
MQDKAGLSASLTTLARGHTTLTHTHHADTRDSPRRFPFFLCGTNQPHQTEEAPAPPRMCSARPRSVRFARPFASGRASFPWQLPPPCILSPAATFASSPTSLVTPLVRPISEGRKTRAGREKERGERVGTEGTRGEEGQKGRDEGEDEKVFLQRSMMTAGWRMLAFM